MELLNKSATELGLDIANGIISSVELTKAYFAAIDANPYAQRIYARLMPERALAEAKASDDRVRFNQRLSALDGVPISWKDLFDTANVATEAGSKLLAGRVPGEDAEIVKRLARAGIVSLGKTHMSELAFSGLGYNPVTETSPCVNDVEAVAGGSSSGAATSVAFGLAALAIGSDTGGSIRGPAVWNDLVGLKSTTHSLPMKGVVPLCSNYDAIGPLARTVADASAAYALMAARPDIDLKNANLKGKKFFIPQKFIEKDVRDIPMAAFKDAIKTLSDAGAEFIVVEMPELEEVLDLTAVLYTVDAYANWRKMIEASPGMMYAGIEERFRAGGDYSAVEYEEAQKRLLQLRQICAKRLLSVDGLVMPTSPILPPKIKRLEEDSEYYRTENLLALRYTRVANFMNLCSLTLPIGVPSCGIVVSCLPYHEAFLLRIGASIEAQFN